MADSKERSDEHTNPETAAKPQDAQQTQQPTNLGQQPAPSNPRPDQVGQQNQPAQSLGAHTNPKKAPKQAVFPGEIVEEFFEADVPDPSVPLDENDGTQTVKKLMVRLYGGEFNKPVRAATAQDKQTYAGQFKAFEDKQKAAGGAVSGVPGPNPAHIAGRASPDVPSEARDTKEFADQQHHQPTPLAKTGGNV